MGFEKIKNTLNNSKNFKGTSTVSARNTSPNLQVMTEKEIKDTRINCYEYAI